MRPVNDPQPGDLYLVTGRERSGKPLTRTFHSWQEAHEFNLFICSKYLVRNGRRRLLFSTSHRGRAAPHQQEP